MENVQRRFALNLLAYAVQRNVSPVQLCKLSGLDFDKLNKDPKFSLTSRQWDNLWSNASHLTNDPLFGLHFGESLQLAALGIVGGIIQTSGTVGEALGQAGSLVHLITDAVTITVNHSRDSFRIQLVASGKKDGDHSFSFVQLMDVLIALVIRELDGLLLKKVEPLTVRYPYTPDNPAEYERVLRCRPMKKTGEFSISFDIAYWNEPILTANYQLQELLLQKVQSGITAGEQGSAQALRVRIYNFLLANSYLGISSLTDIAANFNVSPRNLQRKLKEEGVTYQDLADAVRKSLAIHYLESGNYRVKDISGMLGYNELSAFTRAFKRWTGASPVHYQKDVN